MKLTKAQRDYLTEAERISHNKELSGIVAKGSRRPMAVVLKAAGLLRFVGVGPCVDDEWSTGQEWPIYAITDAGRAALGSPRSSGTAEKEEVSR